MLEFDTRLEAKKNAEFITPVKLREFLSSKIKENNINVLEPAIGSGQLLFNIKDKIKSIDGFDVNNNAVNYAKQNFSNKINGFNQNFILSEINKHYDVAIANYPFSLKPNDDEKKYICNDVFLSQFYRTDNSQDIFGNYIKKLENKNITGKLDFIFILKSFYYSNSGYYFCYPGIGYRQEEKKFRKYLIDNKFIKEYGIIENCKFDHTGISILFLHLTKEKNEQSKSFKLNLETNKVLEKIATFEDYNFDLPQKVIEKDYCDPVEMEMIARENVISIVKAQLMFSKTIASIDPKVKDKLPIENFKNDLIQAINSIP
jgi:hypothetical protein